MPTKIAVALLLGLLCVAPLTRAAAAADAPATAPFDYTVPQIPVERIKFSGTGYPQIPGDVQVLIDRRDDVWARMSRDSFDAAMPEVLRWEKMGRPYVRVA